jgi:hypothetical protein
MPKYRKWGIFLYNPEKGKISESIVFIDYTWIKDSPVSVPIANMLNNGSNAIEMDRQGSIHVYFCNNL